MLVSDDRSENTRNNLASAGVKVWLKIVLSIYCNHVKSKIPMKSKIQRDPKVSRQYLGKIKTEKLWI